jgi:hypothetical protein
MPAPGVSALKTVGKDARSWVVGAILAAGVAGWKVLLHHHVRVRAWVVVLVAVVVVLALIGLDWMRSRERDRATGLQGALDRAEATATQAAAAAAEPQPNRAAREVLATIVALSNSIHSRVQAYAGTHGIDSTRVEFDRFRYVMGRVQALIQPMPKDLNNLLVPLGGFKGDDPPPVDTVISILDHVEAEVTIWGLANPHEGPAPQAGGRHVIAGPPGDLTIAIEQGPFPQAQPAMPEPPDSGA